MIIIDQIVTYNDSNTGDNTVPPGVGGLSWCHLVSTTSLQELETFLTVNILTIGALVTNIRKPADGSFVTYIGLTTEQRDAAIFAGAAPQRRQFVFTHAFDYDTNSPPATYEP